MLPLIALVILHFLLLGLLISESCKLWTLIKEKNRYKARVISLVPGWAFAPGMNPRAKIWDENSNVKDIKKYPEVSYTPIVEFTNSSGEQIKIKTRANSTFFQDFNGKSVDVYYKSGMSSAIIAKPICMFDYLIIIIISYLTTVGILLYIVTYLKFR
jgi:hypothetical protein